MNGNDGLSRRERRGPIAYMAGNGVAANLLMVFILIAGLVASNNLVQEVLPEVSLDQVEVSVRYPGATPEEVEESIILKIEEQIEGVDGLKEIRSTAAQGYGSVVAQVESGEDLDRVLDDVKAQVDLQTFPAEAERPEVRELTNRHYVIRLVVHGNAPERTLKELAHRIEDELAALPPVSYVRTTGVRDYEVSIEIPLQQLRALSLTLSDVSNAVRRSSLDLSAGSIETRDEEVRIRTAGQSYVQQDFEDIIILSRADGTVVKLGDIAEVRDGFSEMDLITRYGGERAAYVEVFRTADEKVFDIVDAVTNHVDNAVAPSLPAGLEISIWYNYAELLQDRLGLLVKNGLLGLALVLIALTFFLEIRLAFWVAVGIAVSFVGTIAVMAVLGVSINLVSLFAFILAVGIVVDDAIVVGENIYSQRESGARPIVASIRGTRRITKPVVFAVMTTVVAFCPLFLIPGPIGNMVGPLPIIVISVLVFSLVESLLILPNHLSHLPANSGHSAGRRPNLVHRGQSLVGSALRRFTDGTLDRSLRFATAHPLLVVATGIAMVVISLAMIPAGIIRFTFAPAVEADMVTATLQMPEGTPFRRTSDVADMIEAAGHQAVEEISSRDGTDVDELLRGVNVTVGLPPIVNRLLGPSTEGTNNPRPNVAVVELRFVTAEERNVSTAEVAQRWRDAIGPMPEARSLTIASELLNFGAPVHVDLFHPNPERLAMIGDSLMRRLQVVDGVFDIQSDWDQGIREVQLNLLPAARTVGLTLDDLARQVRSAFFGDEALRIQRGHEEVRVYVRLPEGQRNSIADLESYSVRTRSGGDMPLAEVASIRFGNSPNAIMRRNGQRALTVTADVNATIVTGDEVSRFLEESVLGELVSRNPGLTHAFGGEQQQQVESLGTLGSLFVLAMLAIYALLAIPFGSYTKPLIVMAAIPFGIIGAVLGHLILGINLTVMSLFGLIGLSGVIVNDSLVMIDFIDERLRQGSPAREAIIDGAKVRFRPIFLTSVTTFLGMGPLIFETSLQAQFVIPMAASLGFGIVFGTVVLMMIVPALTIMHHRLVEWWSPVGRYRPVR